MRQAGIENSRTGSPAARRQRGVFFMGHACRIKETDERVLLPADHDSEAPALLLHDRQREKRGSDCNSVPGM
jgi:hypothetical protein